MITVYHIDPSSAEPVGGIARFKTLCNEYRDGSEYVGQPKLLTFFSGDAFNPSLESSVTKGKNYSALRLMYLLNPKYKLLNVRGR